MNPCFVEVLGLRTCTFRNRETNSALIISFDVIACALVCINFEGFSCAVDVFATRKYFVAVALARAAIVVVSAFVSCRNSDA